MLLASLGNVSRAMVGMSAGATGAALTQHFAAGSNAADISAKADSRERATSIIGSLLGMAVTQHLAGEQAGGVRWVFERLQGGRGRRREGGWQGAQRHSGTAQW
jgi:hypothetical protein